MRAVVDQDHAPLERWARHARRRDRGGLGRAPRRLRRSACIGIESQPLPRAAGFVPADGPEHWTAGTLFPLSSKKVARAINAASGSRPLVVLANLSGFDGSPESMRRLQLEYGAEIGRAVVNFRGPIVFCVISRYHGGAFVVFSKTLNERMEIAAVEGASPRSSAARPPPRWSSPARSRPAPRKDPRVRRPQAGGRRGAERRRRSGWPELAARVRSEKLGEVADEFDSIHSVERALKVGSVDRIIAPRRCGPTSSTPSSAEGRAPPRG